MDKINIGDVIWGKIKEKTKSGFIVYSKERKCFLPESQVTNHYYLDFDESDLIGSFYEFEVVKISPNGNLVISRSTLQRIPIKLKQIVLEKLDEIINEVKEEYCQDFLTNQKVDYKASSKASIDYEDIIMEALRKGFADRFGF